MPKRMIVTFAQGGQERKALELTVYNRENQYTEEFVNLTKDFYLKM